MVMEACTTRILSKRKHKQPLPLPGGRGSVDTWGWWTRELGKIISRLVSAGRRRLHVRVTWIA
jgi:hypothetical protein